jgi:hypothetical protein
VVFALAGRQWRPKAGFDKALAAIAKAPVAIDKALVEFCRMQNTGRSGNRNA